MCQLLGLKKNPEKPSGGKGSRGMTTMEGLVRKNGTKAGRTGKDPDLAFLPSFLKDHNKADSGKTAEKPGRSQKVHKNITVLF